MKGDGVLQDYKEAEKWWRLAAEQGYASAQNNLGWMYSKGKGVLQDHKEAIKWWRLAAEQGNNKAQISLSAMYFAGDGVIKDIVIAHMWANIAGSEGHKYAKSFRELLVKEMTASQIEKAQDLARQCVSNNYKGC